MIDLILRILLGLIFISSIQVEGQNLVANYSFENLNEFNIPVAWNPISPTVDVLVEGKKVFEKAFAKDYNLLYSKYLPKIGSDRLTYICLYKHSVGTEAIASKLLSRLQKGKKYAVSMDVYKFIR